MAGFDLLGRLLALAGNRDGQFHALAPPPPPPGPAPSPPPEEPERDLHVAVASKILEGWLANRRQTLVPHTLNVRALPPGQAGLLIAVMAAAAQADGEVDGTEARQIALALGRVGAGEAEAQGLDRALREPRPLPPLLAEVQEAGLGSHAYAAALLAINRRGRANRAFLDYLAARLGLAPEVTGSLERRYRA